MLTGFSAPHSPLGTSGIVPRPPWHNAGVLLAIEYWADPEVAAAWLPPGFLPAEDPGRCVAHWAEWQSTTDLNAELLDPCRGQYMEFFLLIDGMWQGQPASFCPFMFVDTDINLYRGHLQGLAKHGGAIRMTRSYHVAGRAAAPLTAGTQIGATLSHRERRLIDAVAMLSQPVDTPPIGLGTGKVLGLRRYPDLTAGAAGRPIISDLVSFTGYNRALANPWLGTASMTVYPSPAFEIEGLSPVQVGRACRYEMAFTVDAIQHEQDVSL